MILLNKKRRLVIASWGVPIFIFQMADTYFITTHEIMHLIYPVANSYINESVWSGALECTLRDVKMLGETDAVVDYITIKKDYDA